MKPISISGSHFVIGGSGAVITAIEISPIGEKKVVWEEILEPGTEVTKLNWARGQSDEMLFALARKSGGNRYIFEVWVLSLREINLKPNTAEMLRLAELESLTNVDFTVIQRYDSQIVLIIAGNSLISSPEGRNCILIYGISRETEAKVIKRIDNYESVGGEDEEVSIIAMVNNPAMLFVLDRKVGLVVLFFAWGNITVIKTMSLKEYGEPMDIQLSVRHPHLLSITTRHGILLVRAKSLEVEKYVRNEDICDFSWTLGTVQLDNNFIFASGWLADRPIFQVLDFSSLSSFRMWYLDDYIDQSNLINGSDFQLIPTRVPNSFIFIHNDNDGIRLFNMTIGDVKMTGKGKEIGTFGGTIAAFSRLSAEQKTTVPVFIDVISQRNNSIFFGLGYDLDTNSVHFSHIYHQTESESVFRFNPWQFFSGPNLTISSHFSSISSAANWSVDPIPSNYMQGNPINFPFLTTEAQIIPSLDEFAHIVDGRSLLTIDLLSGGKVVDNLTISEGKVVLFCENCASKVLVVEADTGEQRLARVDAGTLYESPPFPSLSHCSKVKLLDMMIACLSPSSLLLLELTSYSLLWTITAESLSLPSLHLIDVVSKYSVRAQVILLYIACEQNGIFVVETTNIMKPQFGFGLSAEAGLGVYMFRSEILARVNSNGSISIFDTTEDPNVREIRVLPSWSDEAISKLGTSGEFLMVQKGEKAYFYHVFQPVHDSLYTIIDVKSNCSLGGSRNLFLICIETQGVVITEIQILGGTESCAFPIKVEVRAKRTGAFGVGRAALEVEATNSYGERCVAEVTFEGNP